jgi:hypothetical protein
MLCPLVDVVVILSRCEAPLQCFLEYSRVNEVVPHTFGEFAVSVAVARS